MHFRTTTADDSIILRVFFDDTILLWLLTTWLIEGVISEIRGVILDLLHIIPVTVLCMINQFAEFH